MLKFGNYVIIYDGKFNWVIKSKEEVKKKNDEIVKEWKVKGYYPNLRSALKCCIRRRMEEGVLAGYEVKKIEKALSSQIKLLGNLEEAIKRLSEEVEDKE